MTKKSLLVWFFLGSFPLLFGQTYRMELGAMAGVSSYLGDANQVLFHESHPSYSLLARYQLNRRFSLKADLAHSSISGSTVGRAYLYPNGKDMAFGRTLLDGSLQMELNFYEYGAPDYQPGASRVSPYVSLGVGAMLFRAGEWQTAACLPIGIGLKCKLTDRLNLGVEACYKASLTDKLDHVKGSPFQLDDPWKAISQWNKNNDGMAVLKVFITYDLFRVGTDCYD